MEMVIKDIRGTLLKRSPCFVEGTEVPLVRSDLLRLDGDQRGTWIASLSGTLWITQSGEEQDRVLQGGQGMTITRRGRVLVQALSDGMARIVPQA